MEDKLKLRLIQALENLLKTDALNQSDISVKDYERVLEAHNALKQVVRSV